MKRNVGGLDRVIRLLVGVFLIGLGLGAIRGKGGLIVAIVGLILLMTSLTAFCGLCVPLKEDRYEPPRA
ncbi:MAG TPA: DUF2892 domain-containing protein [Dehalococcoidia bacterium]|nr:DUF2892 domain-containing protein [Dehalococcoidia bacterium]